MCSRCDHSPKVPSITKGFAPASCYGISSYGLLREGGRSISSSRVSLIDGEDCLEVHAPLLVVGSEGSPVNDLVLTEDLAFLFR